MNEREVREKIRQAIATIIENIDCTDRVSDAVMDKVCSDYADVIEDAYVEAIENRLDNIIESEITDYDYESEVDF